MRQAAKTAIAVGVEAEAEAETESPTSLSLTLSLSPTATATVCVFFGEAATAGAFLLCPTIFGEFAFRWGLYLFLIFLFALCK